MDFDKLMDRYDNLLLQLSLYQTDSKNWKAKYLEEKSKNELLEKQLAELKVQGKAISKYPTPTPHYQLAQEVYALNPAMSKIELIKEVRYRAGWGLQEAKDAVEKVLYKDGKG